eukprot:SAG25_NODE_6705_length_536_cov_1.167048_1_plen_46_part_00
MAWHWWAKKGEQRVVSGEYTITVGVKVGVGGSGESAVLGKVVVAQ